MSAIFTGKNLVRLERVTSTNSILSEMLSNSKPLVDGSAIMADEQTQGRGQQGAFWESSPSKNITLSLLYRPEFLAIDSQFYLSIAVSLGICDMLKDELNQEVQIKWPNDIYINNKKIAGILIENTLIGNKLKTSIIGIGLNVNQTEFISNAPNPCSMKNVSGKEYNLEQITDSLFESIENWYLQLKGAKFTELKNEYLKKLFRYKQEGYYKIDGHIVKAEIVDIDTSGRLVILVNNEIKTFDTKEIEFIL